MPNPNSGVHVSIDEHVDEITIDECEDISIDLLNFSPAKQAEIRHLTSTNPVMKTLLEIIHGGCPENIKDLPVDVRTYWSFRDELSMQNGIILKGNQVIIPDQLRHNIIEQLHASYQGIDKTKKLARECLFWPGMPKSVENICASCHLCQGMQHQQTPQPLHPHERPMSPWVKVGSDIFTIGSNNFLIFSDYFSRYPVVKKLPSLSASATISATKEAFSILGTHRVCQTAVHSSNVNTMSSVSNGTFVILQAVLGIQNQIDSLNAKFNTSSLSSRNVSRHLVIFISPC